MDGCAVAVILFGDIWRGHFVGLLLKSNWNESWTSVCCELDNHVLIWLVADITFRMHLSAVAYIKDYHIDGENYRLDITNWLVMNCALNETQMMCDTSIRFENACLFAFGLNDTLDHIFTFFIIWPAIFHGLGQENFISCPGPVKIVVNFLHRVCTMLWMICTETLS